MTEQSNLPFYYEIRENHYISIEQIFKITDVCIEESFHVQKSIKQYSVIALTPNQTGNDADTHYTIAKSLDDLGAAKLILITFLEKLNGIRREHLNHVNSNVNRI